jgi:hypothetical protein
LADLKSLPEVASEMKDGLFLEKETIGEVSSGLLTRLFPGQARFQFHVTQSTLTTDRLTLEGHFSALGRLSNVKAKLALFSIDSGSVRHCIFCLNPDGNAFQYISQFGSISDARWLDQDWDEDPGPSSDLDELPGFVDFSSTQSAAVVFSSIAAPDARVCPDWLEESFPREQLRTGLNFRAALYQHSGLKVLAEIFKAESGESAACQAFIFPEGPGVFFAFRQVITGLDLSIGQLRGQLEAVTLASPLSADDTIGSRIQLDGALAIDGTRLRISADYNSALDEIRLSFIRFPSLNELLAIAGITKLPEPLHSLTTITIQELSVFIRARSREISEISFKLGTEELDLIPGVISLVPEVTLSVLYPFDSNYRKLEGRLTGNWELGGETKIVTALDYPSYIFTAQMDPAKPLALNTLTKKLKVPEIGLPNFTITQMEIQGDLRNKSFAARISIDSSPSAGAAEPGTPRTWKIFSVGTQGHPISLELDSISMSLVYQNEALESWTVNGKFTFAACPFSVTAGYDRGQGWTFVAEAKTVSLGKVIDDVLHTNNLPSTFPQGLELNNIVFSAAVGRGEYCFSGQLAATWTVAGKFSLQVEQFTIAKLKDLGISIIIGVQLELPPPLGIHILLRGEKKADKGGGWRFEGSTGHGEKLAIGELVQWIGKQFDVQESQFSVPPAIKSFSISNLEIGFDTATSEFWFTCDGALLVEKTKLEFRQITIKVSRSADGYSTEFGGELVVQEQHSFKVRFETAQKVQASTLFAASYHNAAEKPVKIDPILAAINCPIDTGLEIRFTDALFAYAKDAAPPAMLFGLRLGAGIDLSGLVSKFEVLRLAGITSEKQSLKVDDLQVLYASERLTQGSVQKLNRLLSGDGNRLLIPSKSSAGSPESAIEQGLHLSARLTLGSGESLLSLPAQASPRSDPPSQPELQGSLRQELAATVKWFEIKKSFGPLYLARVGFQYQNQRVGFLLDSSVELMGMRVGLLGFGVSAPVAALSNPTLEGIQLDLQGLELGFKQGPVEISGGLLVSGGGFVGSILIKTEAFSIFGLGAYQTIKNQPSLFIFAVLDKDLGGPPCFHVTGLAAGFGFNRKLTLPTIDKVADYALIKAAVQPPKNLLDDARTINEEVTKPAVGEYWLAAGVRFTSFEMIESFVLLSVSFGTETVISILGLSRITVPAKAPPKTPIIASAELALMVSFRPESGVLMAEARLTPNSYVFTKDCKLTGGFAFYAWFKDLGIAIPGKDPNDAGSRIRIAAGDFVITLGGYHSRFQKPAHYPLVPRLGLAWKVSENLRIAGEVYFALTPSCLMLGGRLSALYQQGGIRAWFDAYADFLIAWQPLHYDAAIGVRIGVAYVGALVGISINFGIELSADVHLWGPPLAGKAEIQCTFISFTVYFGQHDKPHAEALKWTDFANAFLPPGNESLTVTAVGGLLKEVKEKEVNYLIVNPYQVKLLVKSAVPSQSISVSSPVTGGETDRARSIGKFEGDAALGIRPMGITRLKSLKTPPADEKEKKYGPSLTIRVFRTESGRSEQIPMQASSIRQDVPKALWGGDDHLDPKTGKPRLEETQLIAKALTGVELCPPAPSKRNDLWPITELGKKVEEQKRDDDWNFWYAPTGQKRERSQVMNSLRDPQKLEARYALVERLAAQGWIARNRVPAKAALGDAYQKMHLEDAPVGCGVGMLPQFP